VLSSFFAFFDLGTVPMFVLTFFCCVVFCLFFVTVSYVVGLRKKCGLPVGGSTHAGEDESFVCSFYW